MNLDYSDVMIFAGSVAVGVNGSPLVVFTGGTIASLGVNIQFEETRLSIMRIFLLSMAGYLIGAGIAKAKSKLNFQ